MSNKSPGTYSRDLNECRDKRQSVISGSQILRAVVECEKNPDVTWDVFKPPAARKHTLYLYEYKNVSSSAGVQPSGEAMYFDCHMEV